MFQNSTVLFLIPIYIFKKFEATIIFIKKFLCCNYVYNNFPTLSHLILPLLISSTDKPVDNNINMLLYLRFSLPVYMSFE